ncbi:hypothetical protein PENTCL1PPCAC_6631 [Pristionchus entomophagus]|uniref:ETS domain-containing protein n=1 Tax=Pristionchus entomophagus TaxID=358040 RepID=A0AAV5SY48_9BILA|nr:hypothetical protein PENTCL1PPCAC_6631 [Pristionchus entomophagus]
MDPPFGYDLSPIALTRTVQSILAPCLYSGPSSSVEYSSHPGHSKHVKIEEKLIKEEEMPSTMLIDRYAETVDTVARSYKLEEIEEKLQVKKPKKGTFAKKKERVKMKKRRLCANPILLKAPLIVKEELSTNQSNGNDQMWWFILKLLMDPANGHIIAWTGQYYSFRVLDKEIFTQMWCDHNDRSRLIEWSSVCRAMRLCYGEKGILTPVSQRDRIWAFIVDISIPLKISREVIQEYIDLHRDVPQNPLIFDDKSDLTKMEELGIDESAREIRMDPSSHHPYIPITVSDPLFCDVDSASLPPSPFVLSPLKLDFSNRPPLMSPLFFKTDSFLSPLSSPYWLPVPIFSSYFHF